DGTDAGGLSRRHDVARVHRRSEPRGDRGTVSAGADVSAAGCGDAGARAIAAASARTPEEPVARVTEDRRLTSTVTLRSPTGSADSEARIGLPLSTITASCSRSWRGATAREPGGRATRRREPSLDFEQQHRHVDQMAHAVGGRAMDEIRQVSMAV